MSVCLTDRKLIMCGNTGMEGTDYVWQYWHGWGLTDYVWQYWHGVVWLITCGNTVTMCGNTGMEGSGWLCVAILAWSGLTDYMWRYCDYVWQYWHGWGLVDYVWQYWHGGVWLIMCGNTVIMCGNTGMDGVWLIMCGNTGMEGSDWLCVAILAWRVLTVDRQVMYWYVGGALIYQMTVGWEEWDKWIRRIVRDLAAIGISEWTGRCVYWACSTNWPRPVSYAHSTAWIFRLLALVLMGVLSVGRLWRH